MSRKRRSAPETDKDSELSIDSRSSDQESRLSVRWQMIGIWLTFVAALVSAGVSIYTAKTQTRIQLLTEQYRNRSAILNKRFDALAQAKNNLLDMVTPTDFTSQPSSLDRNALSVLKNTFARESQIAGQKIAISRRYREYFDQDLWQQLTDVITTHTEISKGLSRIIATFETYDDSLSTAVIEAALRSPSDGDIPSSVTVLARLMIVTGPMSVEVLPGHGVSMVTRNGTSFLQLVVDRKTTGPIEVIRTGVLEKYDEAFSYMLFTALVEWSSAHSHLGPTIDHLFAAQLDRIRKELDAYPE